jgi:hypothetical protein
LTNRSPPEPPAPIALIGYARVSTEDQLTQLDKLRAAGCRDVLEEHASYQTTHEVTVFAQSRVAMGRIRAGAAMSLFHAIQHASTIASYVA